MIAIRSAIRKHDDAMEASAESISLLVTEPELVAAIRAECRRLLIRFSREPHQGRSYYFRPLHDVSQSQREGMWASEGAALDIARRVGEDLGALLTGLRAIASWHGERSSAATKARVSSADR